VVWKGREEEGERREKEERGERRRGVIKRYLGVFGVVCRFYR
jgi:hypothetical protein